MALTFDLYQYRAGQTAIYPESDTGSVAALSYVGLGLGEAGEVQGKIKKILRDDAGNLTDEKRSEIAKELGDVLWYVARTASELGIPLAKIAQQNLDKLSSRSDSGTLKGSGDDR